jgi:hypothetical protein
MLSLSSLTAGAAIRVVAHNIAVCKFMPPDITDQSPLLRFRSRNG